MVTDPPYGVGYDPSWRAHRGLSRGKLAQGKVLNDDRADWREAYALFPGDAAYVWFGALRGDIVAAGLAACGFQVFTAAPLMEQTATLDGSTMVTMFGNIGTSEGSSMPPKASQGTGE
jgi:hypothetical protein